MLKRLISVLIIAGVAGPALSQEAISQDQAYFNSVSEAASKGDCNAQVCLGNLNAIGLGTSQDLVRQQSLYRSAEEKGDLHARQLLAELYMYGFGVSKDTQKGLAMLHALVDGGYLPAATDIGLAYATGNGLPKDQTQALKWYEKAANANDYWAEARLALKYRFGDGVQADPKTAKRWLDRATNNEVACYSTFGIFFPYIINGYLNKPASLPEDLSSISLVIGFTYRDRRATDVFVYRSSGMKALDEAWLAATREAILPPWPSAFPDEMKKMAFMVRGSKGGANPLLLESGIWPDGMSNAASK